NFTCYASPRRNGIATRTYSSAPRCKFNDGSSSPMTQSQAGRIRYQIGVDIGGTFTDVVLLGSNGQLHTHKTLSTPDDYGRGIVQGIAAALKDLGAGPESRSEEHTSELQSRENL